MHLSPCAHWSIENACCRAYYSALTGKRFDNFSLNFNDFDKTCKGKSNISLCVWFVFNPTIVTYNDYKKNNYYQR